ncbi:glutamate-cysteine ligase 2 family protein [Mycobacterium avium subsp. avium 2285 (R)]|nr:glutamate-cysteine ligase 2 family protein [Mycobacterium avium subsp. avium 2285 (R)]
MIAMTANSPMLDGDFTGWVSSRQRVWGRMDSARCGPILGASGDDPGTDWARYALKAPVMLVHTPDAEAVTRWVPFADWVDGRVLLGGRRPTVADLEYHLTTLFPPVRPRQWLEIRYLDSVPDTLWPAVVFTLVALLDDPVAAGLAARAVEPVATAWDVAARVGLRDRRLYAAANACLAIAAERAPAELAEPMRRLVRLVEQGRCPGDDFADQVIEHGIAASVSRAARARKGGRDVTGGDRRPAGADAGADAAAGRLRRRRAAPAVRPVDEPAGVGSRAHRPAGGAVAVAGGDPARPGMLPPAVEGLYDAFVHSRASRVDLPLLSPEQARAYCRKVRAAVLDTLDALPDDPDAAFVYAMVVSHENQHDETMLQALNLRSGAPLLRDTSVLPAGRPELAGTSVLVPGGEFVLGVDAADEPESLDNERPAHVLDLPAFRIGTIPVTNGEWQQFVADGGYDEPRWWSRRGWQHRQAAGLTAPSSGTPTRAPAPGSAMSKTSRPTNRCSMSAFSRPRRTRPGPVPGCPPRWSGRRPARGIRPPAPGAAIRGERRRRRRPWRTWAAPRCAPPRRRLPGRRLGVRGRTDARRRVGVDDVPAAALAGLRADALRTLFAAVL